MSEHTQIANDDPNTIFGFDMQCIMEVRWTLRGKAKDDQSCYIVER